MHFDQTSPIIKARCAGRISLSKHIDYINGDLLYLLDDRETHVYSQLKPGSGLIKLINQDFGNREFNISELATRLENKLDWSFYIVKLLEELKLIERLPDQDLIIEVKTSLPAAGGLSSSHALLLSSIRNFAKLFELAELEESFDNPHKDITRTFKLIKLCQKIEQDRGFKSGLGDQCAQIFSKTGHLTNIKIFPELKVNYIPIPAELSFITAPSFISADKSTPEFIEKNRVLEKYKTVNEIAKEHDVEYLADLLDKHDEKTIFKILGKIEDKTLRGLALYGLAESLRVKNLVKNFSCEELGKHLKLSHQAEKIYNFKGQQEQEITEAQKLDYLFDPKKSLAEHSGFYYASTYANDLLQDLAINHEACFGSSISGAGFGGNNTIACKSAQTQELRDHLLVNYYKNHAPDQNLNLLHISKSNSAVSLMS